jgi:hypothetical protein
MDACMTQWRLYDMEAKDMNGADVELPVGKIFTSCNPTGPGLPQTLAMAKFDWPRGYT